MGTVWARVDLVTTRTRTRRTRRPVTRGGQHTRALPYLSWLLMDPDLK